MDRVRKSAETRPPRGRGSIGTAVLALACGLAVLAVWAAPAGAATQTFSNPGAITVPKIAGPAAPYPSQITASGLSGQLTKVTASLHGFAHTFPADVAVLLVGPTGQTTVLMSDAPGDDPSCEADVTGLDLTFDDAAAGPIPPDQTLVSGTYQPTDVQGFVDKCGVPDGPAPPPAPAGPYGATLSGFNGTAPNGAWDLYVFDDSDNDDGQIANGWSLTLTDSSPAPNPPAAAKDPKCKRLRKKLKAQKRRLARAGTAVKRSMIKRNIGDTRKRLRRLRC